MAPNPQLSITAAVPLNAVPCNVNINSYHHCAAFQASGDVPYLDLPAGPDEIREYRPLVPSLQSMARILGLEQYRFTMA